MGLAEQRIALELVRAEQARRRRVAAERQALTDRLDEIRHNCRTLHGFMRESWHVLEPLTPFLDNWHLGAVCEHLEAVHNGEITGLLVINMPPGCMKSMTVSVLFNPWEWGPGKRPGLRYLSASYREDLTNRDSRKSRDLITSEWYQTLWPEVRLVQKGDSEFTNTFFGRRKAVPFMSLTGDRGNRVLIDDPHSIDLVESERDRPKTVQRFRESVPSRVNDPVRDVIIVMMQRMHPDDVCGAIEDMQWPATKLILPMEYIKSSTVTTKWFSDPRTVDGELLHPARYPREKIELDKIPLGTYGYDTQYQQMPRARDGSYFFNRRDILVNRMLESGAEEWYPVERPRACDAVFAIADTATKVGHKRDGTGSSYWALTLHPKPSLVILDWDVTQMQANTLRVWLPGVVGRLEELARQCGARAGSVGVHIEDKDSGQVLLQDGEAAGLPVHAIPSEFTALGKEGRAVSVSGYVNRGMVKICREAFDKVSIYKGKSRNHFLEQVTTFRIGYGTPDDDDELFDNFCYGVHLGLGDSKMGKH